MEGTYNLSLVSLSLVIAIIASYTALDLATRLATAQGRLVSIWLVGGAFAMGAGIWSMHFVGMLAFNLPIPMGYDLSLTILSLIIAIVVSGCALWVMKGPVLTSSASVMGAILVGSGIATMHYTGMAAMRMFPPINYDPAIVTASIAIAIISAWLALKLAFWLPRTHSNSIMVILAKFGSAIALGLGISGMHYTAMAAASYAPDSVCRAADVGIGIDNLALASIIALIIIIILMVTIVTSALDTYFATENAKLAGELKSANAQLHNIAMYDHLTGLPGRLLLKDRLQLAVNRSDRSKKSFAYLMIDLDRFKPVNDSFGHHVGDKLLKSVAERLLCCIRKEDTAARIGGDEFVIVLNELTTDEDVKVVSNRILDELSRPFVIEGHKLDISCSIGISVYPRDGKELNALTVKADQAMYHAKRGKGMKQMFFASEIDTAAPELKGA